MVASHTTPKNDNLALREAIGLFIRQFQCSRLAQQWKLPVVADALSLGVLLICCLASEFRGISAAANLGESLSVGNAEMKLYIAQQDMDGRGQSCTASDSWGVRRVQWLTLLQGRADRSTHEALQVDSSSHATRSCRGSCCRA